MDASDILIIILAMLGFAALVLVLFLIGIGIMNLMFGVLDYFNFTYDRTLAGSIAVGVMGVGAVMGSVTILKGRDND